MTKSGLGYISGDILLTHMVTLLPKEIISTLMYVENDFSALPKVEDRFNSHKREMICM
jgi:hypothetical protein